MRNYAGPVENSHRHDVEYGCTLLLCCMHGAISFNKRRWFGDRCRDGVPKLTPVQSCSTVTLQWRKGRFVGTSSLKPPDVVRH